MTPAPAPALDRHLDAWLGGRLPSDGSVRVVPSPRREEPGWDGRRQPFIAVVSPEGAVLSVPPGREGDVGKAVGDLGPSDLAGARPGIAAALGQPGARVIEGVFRWSTDPADHPDAGVWVAADDRSVPAWLKPFGGEVLMALDDDGRYIAGVGLKRHDPTGQEIAVVTEEAARGRGLARRLVCQAARRVVGAGAVVTYLHAPDNVASAHVAEASGFPDLGWRILALIPG